MKKVASPVLAGLSLLIVGGIITNSIIDGEQLLVKFLATVVVAALGLYIISDLRLRQSENSTILSSQQSSIGTIQHTESGLSNMPIIRSNVAEESVTETPPSNSTAAFIANMNKTKELTAATATNSRSYSAMGRVTQRSRRSTNPEELVVASTAPATLQARSNEIELTDLDETTLDASPLQTLRVESGIEELIPGEPHITELTSSDEHFLVIDIDENPTSMLILPTEAEVAETDFDESVTWILPDDPAASDSLSDDADETSAPLKLETDVIDADSSHVTPAESDPEIDSDPIEGEPSDVDISTSYDLVGDVADTASSERRRFTPEDINIEDLRSVDLEAVQQDAPTQSPASASSLAAINDAIADGEQNIVRSLIERGVLSSDGPLTDNDVTTMIYVAFTSSELRTLLKGGGTMDTASGEISLEGLGIYTTDELEKNDQFLVAASDKTLSQLETKADN